MVRDGQPNKGMLIEHARNTAAMLKQHRVYSWWRGQWWLVDHGSAEAMAVSAASRQVFVTSPRLHPRTFAVIGPPINPAGRFVCCAPGVLPA